MNIPPSTARIASTNPAIGIPVVCIGTVLVVDAAFTVLLLELFCGCTLTVNGVNGSVFLLKVSEVILGVIE